MGTSNASSTVLQLDYSYGTTNNNGNVLSQTITVPGVAQPFAQSYGYDPLNRLQSADEVIGTTSNWKQVYSFDRFGNRTLGTGTTLPNSLNDTNNPSISADNNRINAQGYSHDPAGNLTAVPGWTYAFDAENKMTGASDGQTVSSYEYDGNGRRVKKIVGSITTLFVYDADNKLVAEYSNQTTESGGTNYITQDTLGSTRVVTGQDQSVKTRHDYLPYGEELFVGRTAQGYGSSIVRQKFTSKERDNETGLDYFLARYYSSTQGRFTSPDPLLDSAEPERPQTWNRYSYVLNNPLKYIDPDGLRYVQRTLTDGQIQYGWCATDDCYNNAIDTKAKGYAGWTAVTFDESKSFEYLTEGVGPDRYGTYRLNPDGTHGYAKKLDGVGMSMSIDWTAQLAIGGMFQGLFKGLGGLFTRQAVTRATTQTAQQATTHGAQRLAERGFSAADIVLTKSGQQFLQRDGARVFLKEVAPGKFNVVVEGTRGVVTALKSVSEKKVAKLAQQYGWHSPLK